VATYEKSDTDHRTGRKCTVCNGALHDSIINFGEYLDEKTLDLAYQHAKKADLCLALGSSLRVPPANKVPTMVGNRKAAKLVICNLQDTHLDSKAKMRVYTKTDDLMIRVMQKLDIPIPPFVIRRRMVVEVSSKGEDKNQIRVRGVDVDGTPVSFLQAVKLEGSRRACKSEPFAINFSGDLETGMDLQVELEFMGHYGEPNLVVSHEYRGVEDRLATYELSIDPLVREWTVRRLDE
jgi:mono-ADP-ribosyltransferase sirtuin 6